MAATIEYRINEGTPPFTVTIDPAVQPTQIRNSVGTYTFDNIPDGVYEINVIDSLGFHMSFDVTIACEPVTTTTLPPTAECLDGLIIEAIYIATPEDHGALPEQYIHPCFETIGSHRCNRALFEIFAVSEIAGVDSVCVGGLRMNNLGGVGEFVSECSGYTLCKDYENRSQDFGGVTWPSDTNSRYDKIVISQQTALDIAAATSGSTTINFAFVGTSNMYGIQCAGQLSDLQHEEVTWLRISAPTGEVIYNGCPVSEDVIEVDICDWTVSTTTTTTFSGSTTTTTTIEPVTTTTTTVDVSSLETVFIHIPNATTTTTSTIEPTTTTSTTSVEPTTTTTSTTIAETTTTTTT